jgi:uncharacterized phage protein (TIGR01671 family)
MLSSNEVGDHTLNNLEQLPFTLMQFTGLQDEHGHEIYEGDILLNPGDIDEHTDKYWVVKFLSGSFTMQTLNQIRITTYKNLILQSRIQIVGNIYEHPNLLHNA